MSRLKSILAVHLALALTPIGTSLVPVNFLTMVVLWSLATIPSCQLVLLSVYLGMTVGNVTKKLAIATAAVVFLAFVGAVGTFLRTSDIATASFGTMYIRLIGTYLAILILLTLVMACARRFVGRVRWSREPIADAARSRFHFSLFALLVVLSTVALLIGLARASRTIDASKYAAGADVEYLLIATVFAINMLLAVWAALGSGFVARRMLVVFCVSAMLGLSIGISGSLDTVDWWLFASSSLVTLVPTAIVALTLLHARRLGYRLVANPEATHAEGSPIEVT